MPTHLPLKPLQERLQQTAAMYHREDENALLIEAIDQAVAVNETLAQVWIARLGNDAANLRKTRN